MTTSRKLLDRFFNYQKPKVATLPPTRGAWPDKGNTMRLVRIMMLSLSMVGGVSTVVRSSYTIYTVLGNGMSWTWLSEDKAEASVRS